MISLARFLAWILLFGTISAFNVTAILKNIGQHLFSNSPVVDHRNVHSRSLENVVNDAIKNSEDEQNIFSIGLCYD